MTDPEIKTAYDEVLRKIGRNLILFQAAEYCIKELIAMGSFRFAPSDGPRSFADLVQGMNKDTMGGLKNRLFENHFYDGKEPMPDLPDPSDPPENGISLTFDMLHPDLSERRAAVDRMVVERNELVHHLLPKLRLPSLDSCNDVSLWLDHQREVVLPTAEWLQEQVQTVHKQIMLMLQSMQAEKSAEMKRTSELQQSPAIAKLASLAEATTDPEGWISVRDAYRCLDEEEQGEIARLRKCYNLTSLSSVIVASQLFELRLEQCDQGPGRAFCRLTREALDNPH